MKNSRTHRSICSRRQFIAGVGAAAAAVATDAFCIEPNWLRITEHDIPVAKLPRGLDGYKIAQISDAHLRGIGTVEEKILKEIENRDVSLVLLTGDIIDNPARLNLLREFCSALRGKQRHVRAILGNWEHHEGMRLRDLQACYQSGDTRLLINESELVDSSIRVAATDESLNGHFSLKNTLREYLPSAVNLFITHSPGVLDRIPARTGRFDLTLAGHTHGGQGRIGPFTPILPPGCGRFVSGWYEIPIGKAYISCGTGTTAIPARFSCRPELPIFTFRQG
jgi:predicted MPP superfamily phosphohydrolase